MTTPTINEIRQIEKVLGLKKDAFGDEKSERVEVIRYWDNCDVVACPGSGKTTVLLAKLLYLSRKMPFENGKGICVLTHTNVAIDEIKKRLGSKANILFQHPNFFGTTQSFVDRFLTIPFCLETYGTRVIVDSEKYLSFLKKIYKLPYFKKGWFEARKGFDFIKTLKFKFADEFVISNKFDGEPFVGQHTDTYKDFLKTKNQITRKGIVSYDDAYSFAGCFVKKYPTIKDIISKRFYFLFVDEMQDTQPHQMKIIDGVFNENVVKQFYGDPDQAIFNGISGGESAWRIDNGEKLEITESKRFGSSIAKIVSKFSQENGEIEGCGCSEINIKPYLILYKTGDELQVVDKFKELIKNHKLHEVRWDKPTAPFKAIGYVGKKESENLKIQTYFPDYKKARHNKKQYFENLISYFQKRPAEEIKEKGTSVYYNLIISAILQMLQLSECKNEKDKYYNKNMFLKILQNEEEQTFIEFLRKAAVFIKEIQRNGDESNTKKIKEDFLKYFMDKIAPLFESFDEKKVKDFVEDGYIEKVSDIPKVSGENDIEIEVSTVHSVKGETHLATLFLETYNLGRNGKNGCESEKLKCLFCEKEKMKDLNSNKERQKIAYVAMSRPSHLLCVAVNEEHLDCNNCGEDEKRDCIWQIENI